MSIKDAIQSLEEADEKLKKAAVLENSAIAKQKDAARVREESQRDLEKIRIESSDLNKARAGWAVESSQKEQELKNREVKLSVGQADLLNNTAANTQDFVTKNAALDVRTATTDKADRRIKEFEATLDKRAEKYKSIAEFINATL